MIETYSVRQLAHYCGISELCLYESLDELPKPEIRVGKRRYWSDRQLEECRDAALTALRSRPEKPIDMVRINTIARSLGICWPVVNDYITNGLIPAPTHEWGRTKYYTEAEAAEIKKTIIKHRQYDEPRKPNKTTEAHKHIDNKRREQGYLSTVEVGKICNLTNITVAWHIKKGHIPGPTHYWPGSDGRFFTPEEVIVCCEFLEKRAKKWKEHKQKRNSLGLYSRTDICDELQVSRAKLSRAIVAGHIPGPKITGDLGQKYYDAPAFSLALNVGRAYFENGEK